MTLHRVRMPYQMDVATLKTLLEYILYFQNKTLKKYYKKYYKNITKSITKNITKRYYKKSITLHRSRMPFQMEVNLNPTEAASTHNRGFKLYFDQQLC